MAMPDKSPPSIVLIHGNDEFLVEEDAKNVLQERCPGARDQGLLSTIRGDVETADAALQAIRETLGAVQTLSMFGDSTSTWLRSVSFLAGRLFQLESVKEMVERFQETLGRGLGPGQFLLVTVQGKLPANSRFLKALAGVAEVREHSSKGGGEKAVLSESVARLRELFKAAGIRCEEEALQEVAARCQNDTRRMLSEVEKLDLYLGERRTLNRADVEMMVGALAETQVYLIGEAITRRDLPMALRILQQMEQQGPTYVMLIAILHNTLREMAFLGALLDQGAVAFGGSGLKYRDAEAEREFALLTGEKTRSPWRQAQLARQSQQFSVAQLDAMVRLSADTYHQMFRSPLPQFEVLRLFVIRLCYMSRGRAA